MAWEKIEASVLEWIASNPDLWDDSSDNDDDGEQHHHTLIRESKLPGPERVAEIMRGHPRRFRELLRLTQPTFLQLVCELKQGGLKDEKDVTVEEKVMYALMVLGHGWNTRNVQEFFIRSATSICRYVGEVVDAINRLAKKYITMPKVEENKWIESRSDLYPYFAGALGAVDGTHIPAILPVKEQAPFRNRGGGLTQNVLAAVDWHGRFIFTLVGWEGSAHDGRLWADAKARGFKLPLGYYVLGDAGFPTERMVLTPYRRVRYHLKEWGSRAKRPRTAKELFNRRHSSARSIIERTFGVLKARFRILTAMRPYSYKKQCSMVQACFVLHNFIRHHSQDEGFDLLPVRQQGVQAPLHDDGQDDVADDIDVDIRDFRDKIAEWMFRDYQQRLQATDSTS